MQFFVFLTCSSYLIASVHGLTLDAESATDYAMIPLYPGYGMRMAYMYIGDPAQRQSVMIDTASTDTSVTEISCQKCGIHTDPYFDPGRSDSFMKDTCDGKSCFMRNVLGKNMWSGYAGLDDIFLSGADVLEVTNPLNFKFNLRFACANKVTGDFTEIPTNGVIGLGKSDVSFMSQMSAKHKMDNVFSLCMSLGGGVLTLGGVNPQMRSQAYELHYTALIPNENDMWRVKIDKIQLETTSQLYPVGKPADMKSFDVGKGTIIDSATTETYLPSNLAKPLIDALELATGIVYDGSDEITLTPQQLSKMPAVVFTFLDLEGKPFNHRMLPAHYLVKISANTYQFNINADEKQGAVLGLNFMTGHNIVFDASGKIGFVESDCNYADFHKSATKEPTMKPTKRPTSADNEQKPQLPDDCDTPGLIPASECDAYCDQVEPTAPYMASGSQDWVSKCDPETVIEERPCHIPCSMDNVPLAGTPNCPTLPWSECSKTCTQTRNIQALEKGVCKKVKSEKKTCYANDCPLNQGDYLVFIDLKIEIDTEWGYAVSENFFDAFASLFKISASDVDVLADDGIFIGPLKVQVQIRLAVPRFMNPMQVISKGESIVEEVNDPDFPALLIAALNETSTINDKLDYSRYGWMDPSLVKVVNVLGLPVSKERNADYHTDLTGSSSQNSSNSDRLQFELLITGIALAAIAVSCVLGCLYCNLRQSYSVLEKNKNIGGTLNDMWKRYKAERKFKQQQGNYKKVRTTELSGVNHRDFDDFEDNSLGLDDDVNG